ncbi:cell envelope integrity protein TolA [Glaciimonas sp. GG7]
MTDRTLHAIPKEPGRWRAIALAAVVHAALIAFLWIGVHWQSQVPVAIEAEIWSPNVKEAAPPPEPTPEPIEKPPPTPEPKPEPKPVVQEAPPPPKVVEPIAPDPEIALEKERKRKAQEKKEHDHAQQVREDKERQRQADEQERKDEAKKDAEKLAEKQKAIADAKKKAEAEAKKAEDAADKLRAKQDAAKKAAKDKAETAATEKRHSDDMKRLMGQATGTGASNSTGTAAQSQGPRGDPGYGQKVGAKIKGNINFNVPDGMTGNPAVEFDVQLLPDGSVAGIQLKKSSGISGFDEAVKRAIEKSAPYPKDKSGSVPSSFIGIHKPKDQ